MSQNMVNFNGRDERQRRGSDDDDDNNDAEDEEGEGEGEGEGKGDCSGGGGRGGGGHGHGGSAATERNSVPGPSGPTEYARAHARNLASTFALFVTLSIENIIFDMTNLEGVRRYGRDRWKPMDAIDLRAFVGLLILAGVYRLRGEATASLWDAESGRAMFRAAMPLKTFHLYSRLLRFDDRETRAARQVTDKLAAVREVWDAWVERLPLLYVPGPEITVDEQLVSFRGRCRFRQYLPNELAKYGIKSWVACDAKSSYAWKMQVYTRESWGRRRGGEVQPREEPGDAGCARCHGGTEGSQRHL